MIAVVVCETHQCSAYDGTPSVHCIDEIQLYYMLLYRLRSTVHALWSMNQEVKTTVRVHEPVAALVYCLSRQVGHCAFGVYSVQYSKFLVSQCICSDRIFFHPFS